MHQTADTQGLPFPSKPTNTTFQALPKLAQNPLQKFSFLPIVLPGGRSLSAHKISKFLSFNQKGFSFMSITSSPFSISPYHYATFHYPFSRFLPEISISCSFFRPFFSLFSPLISSHTLNSWPFTASALRNFSLIGADFRREWMVGREDLRCFPSNPLLARRRPTLCPHHLCPPLQHKKCRTERRALLNFSQIGKELNSLLVDANPILMLKYILVMRSD